MAARPLAARSDDPFGERRAGKRVAAAFSGTGAVLSERSLASAEGSFGSSIFLDLPISGTAEAGKPAALLVAVPLSASGPGEDAPPDFGVRAAIAAARILAAEPLRTRVHFAFLADEKSTLPADLRGRTHAGLRHAADSLEDPEHSLAVYLDLRGEPSLPVLEYGTEDGIAPRYLIESLIDSFSRRGIRLPLAVPFNELYRLRLIEGRSELRLLRERGIGAALLADARGNRRQRAGGAVSADEAAEALADALRRLAAAEMVNDERYSLLSFSDLSFILPEQAAVAVFMLASSFFLLSFLVYSVTHRHLLTARWNVFLKRSWVVAGFLAVLLLCFRAAGLALDLLFSARASIRGTNPNGEAAVKLLLAYSFYYAIVPLLFFKAIPRRAHFYGGAAVMLLASGTLLAAVMDFTFVPVYIWAFAMAFVSSSIPSPSISLIPAILAPLQIVGAAAAAVGSGDAGAAREIIGGKLGVELYLAFASLPFLFLFRRIAILAKARDARRARKATVPHRLFTRPLLLVGSLMAAFAFASETARTAAETRLPVRAESAESPLFSLSKTDTTFLDSRTVRLEFRSAEAPDRMDLELVGEGRLTIYDSPVPFLLSEDGESASFVLGERPPRPFSLEITLPIAQRARFEARALYYDAETDASRTLRAAADVGPGS